MNKHNPRPEKGVFAWGALGLDETWNKGEEIKRKNIGRPVRGPADESLYRQKTSQILIFRAVKGSQQRGCEKTRMDRYAVHPRAIVL